MMDFHFIRPFVLLLVPIVVALWWIWQRSSDPLRGWREQMDPELLSALTVSGGASGRGPVWAILAGWLLAVIAIAGPTWRLEPSPFADDASPMMILLKADSSMERPDPAPSRMERARLKINDLAEARKGQPLGLIAYAGSAHLVLPPTRDTVAVAEMASPRSARRSCLPQVIVSISRCERLRKSSAQPAARWSFLPIPSAVIPNSYRPLCGNPD